MADGPRINERFPVGESLSPPVVASPIPECAEAVYVSGFVPHATIRVFANHVDKLAEVTPPFGFAAIALSRRVKLGETITATQTVNTITSPHSIVPVVVSATLDSVIKVTRPDVGTQLLECGIVVPVGNLVPGVRVHVSEDGTEIGNEPAAQPWHPVLTAALHAGKKVTAQQIACERTGHEVASPPALPVTVQAGPVPTPPPQPDGASMIPGNDAVTLTGLLVGAGIEVFDHGAGISSGSFATGDVNFVALSPPLSASPSVTATQQLCGPPSKPSDPVDASGSLTAPVVLEPICAHARFVVVRGTTVNAAVVVMRNGAIVGYGGAAPGDVAIGLGANQVLSAGDTVTATQYIGSAVATSNPVTVVGNLRQPSIEILGGEPFFLPKRGEQPIDGPVFPRGRGPGPSIRVQACCGKNVRVDIMDPHGTLVAQPALTELVPGYYTASWPWSSTANWAIPGGIPVGKYTVVAHSGCGQDDARAPFYVIFNPADVGGPPRFSFDDTTVWFGASKNAMHALHYFLHPGDARVFGLAIGAVGGRTDSYDAAGVLSRVVEQRFSYDLGYHANDVVDLLVHHTAAQCADEASCLTALMRAVGIPAHNVSADAAIETGAAHWSFDTWVEFLAPHAGSTEWRVLHPHEYPNMPPESRATFGATRGAATKAFNDLVIMANEQWVFADLDDGGDDVAYARNECQEPDQFVARKTWIDELCEQGYWAASHWDCAGVQTQSFRPGDGFRFHGVDVAFGGRVAGTLHAVNASGYRSFGSLHVEVVSSRPESKRFPDAVFGSATTRVVVDPARTVTMPFDLPLPETLSPGYELYLWAHVDGHTVALHALRPPAPVAYEIDAPREYRLGELAYIRARITGAGRVSLRDVVVSVDAPFALAIEPARQSWGTLRPGEVREASWSVRAIAPLRSGSVHIAIATANTGGVMIRRPLRVVGKAEPVVAGPAFTPKRTK